MSIAPEIQELINDIKEDNTHGASELARQALDTLKAAAGLIETDSAEDLLSQLDEIAERVMSIRPAMAPLYNMVKRLQTGLDDYKNSDIGTLRQTVVKLADELIHSSISAASQIAGFAAGLIKAGSTVMTHSYSSTVASAIKKAYEKHPLKTIVTRSGAVRVGQRTAWEFGYAGIPITYIDDTAMGLFVQQSDVVLVGADRVCYDGGVVNGVGSSLLAIAANYYRVPFYVLCEIAKFDPRMQSSEIEFEDKNPAEVAAAGILPEGVMVKNPYFDLTPMSLVTGVITQDGVISNQDLPAYIEKLANELR
jgi:eIF-2B alpha/beta/delta-like uncharacterized protein